MIMVSYNFRLNDHEIQALLNHFIEVLPLAHGQMYSPDNHLVNVYHRLWDILDGTSMESIPIEDQE